MNKSVQIPMKKISHFMQIVPVKSEKINPSLSVSHISNKFKTTHGVKVLPPKSNSFCKGFPTTSRQTYTRPHCGRSEIFEQH